MADHTLKKLQYQGYDIAVESANRDGLGNKIDTYYLPLSARGIALGVAPLDLNSKVPTTNLIITDTPTSGGSNTVFSAGGAYNLQTAINAKQNALTAGTNINISSNVITCTYSLPTATTSVLGGIKSSSSGAGLINVNSSTGVASVIQNLKFIELISTAHGPQPTDTYLLASYTACTKIWVRIYGSPTKIPVNTAYIKLNGTAGASNYDFSTTFSDHYMILEFARWSSTSPYWYVSTWIRATNETGLAPTTTKSYNLGSTPYISIFNGDLESSQNIILTWNFLGY